MQKTQTYSINDFVQIKSEKGDLIVGKIIEFEKSQETAKIFFFKEYCTPEKCLKGKRSYHSKFELVKCDQTQKEFISKIVKKVNVFLSIDDWVKQVCKPDV